MTSTLELRWQFTPADLFEEAFSRRIDACDISVSPGSVLAAMPTLGNDARPALRTRVEAYIERLFLGAQLIDHTNWTLTGPNICTLHPDGSRGTIIECESGVIRIRGGRVDLRITQSDGTVVDTKRDRIDRKRGLATAAAELGSQDEALARMLRSYKSAIADAQDELIHLFEIRDTLSARFGNQPEALRNLGMPKSKWSRLGLICNELPLREGRHRGRHGTEIRAATEDELAEARALAISLIEAYIQFLRRSAA